MPRAQGYCGVTRRAKPSKKGVQSCSERRKKSGCSKVLPLASCRKKWKKPSCKSAKRLQCLVCLLLMSCLKKHSESSRPETHIPTKGKGAQHNAVSSWFDLDKNDSQNLSYTQHTYTFAQKNFVYYVQIVPQDGKDTRTCIFPPILSPFTTLAS